MKTLDELRTFSEGYRTCLLGNDLSTDLSHTDEWVSWGGYELNIFGQEWGIRIVGDKQALSVDAYPLGYSGDLPEPLHTFDLRLTMQEPTPTPAPKPKLDKFLLYFQHLCSNYAISESIALENAQIAKAVQDRSIAALELAFSEEI